jgi:hypothetical protein
VDIFTIQMSKWRLARNRDIILLDTTVKTGASIFKPTWDMVMGYKAGQISEEEYTRQYWEKMNASWKDPKERVIWLQTIESTEPMAIGCMCPYRNRDTGEVQFCHRHLLKQIFEKLCAARKIPFYFYGELIDE